MPTSYHSRLSLIFYLFLALCPAINGQENIHILDAFYQAIKDDGDDNIFIDLKGGYFLNDINETNNVQIVDPNAIIARHSDAAQYLTEDSTFVIKNQLILKGNVLGIYYDPRMHFKNFELQNGLKFRVNILKKGVEAGSEIFYGSNFIFENLKVNGRSQFDSGGNFILNIYDCSWDQLDLALIKPPKVYLSRNTIDYLQIFGIESDNFDMVDNVIKRGWMRGVESDEVRLDGNTFEAPFVADAIPVEDSSTYFRSQFLDMQSFSITPGTKTINNLELIDNHFMDSGQNTSVLIESAGNKVKIAGNKFDANLRLESRAFASFEMFNNSFSTVSLMASLPLTPQNFVNIDWNDLDGKLVWKRNQDSPVYYGLNQYELAEAGNYNNLVGSYRKLVEVYKNNGNSADANSAYLAMKKLERERFKFVLKKEGGTDNLFRLKLHQLLALYTKHGTDPAQAITASVRLIFLFSIIYFFFPSDWDEKSKSQLLSDFKVFREKNEHGYFRPFLKVVTGFIASMFNAFILSVNSFVTLGFGRIPTHGFAKYICILEGFLGWFLLSIFIVSLINQVLF